MCNCYLMVNHMEEYPVYYKEIGACISYLRKEDNVSLNFVAECLKMNKSVLSQFENGKIKLSFRDINEILHFLDLDLIIDEKSLLFLKDKFLLMFDAYIEMNVPKINKIREMIDESNKMSISLFETKLISFLVGVVNKKNIDDLTFLMDEIEKYFFVYSAKEKFIYYCLKSDLFMMHIKFDECFEILQYAKELMKEVDDLEYRAVLFYLESILYNFQCKPIQSYNSAINALNYFKYASYYERNKYLNVFMAMSLTKMNRFDDSEKLLLNLLKHISDTDNVKLMILNALSWNYLMTGKYEESIKYAEFSLDNGSTMNELFLSKPLALLFQGEYTECLEVVDKELKYITSKNYLVEFLEIIKDYLSTRSNELIEKIENFIKECMKYSNKDMIIIALYLLENIYEKANDTEQQIITLKRIIKVQNTSL